MEFNPGIDLALWNKPPLHILQEEVGFPYLHLYVRGQAVQPFSRNLPLPYPASLYKVDSPNKAILLATFPIFRDSDSKPFYQMESEEDRYGTDSEAPPGHYYLHKNYNPAPGTEAFIVVSEGRYRGDNLEEEIVWGKYIRTGICIHPMRNISTKGCLTLEYSDFEEFREYLKFYLGDSKVLITIQNRHAVLHRDKSVHLIGINGVGMKPLAYILQGEGWHVSGSDRYFDKNPLSIDINKYLQNGISIKPQDGSGVHVGLERVIYSSAVEAEIPDLKKAKELSVPLQTRGEVLASCANSHPCIAICGTAGKTTITVLAGQLIQRWAEELDNLPPFVYAGGYPRDFEPNWAASSDINSFTVIETDEHDRRLTQYTSQ